MYTTSTKVYPSKDLEVCTHLQAYSDDAAQRDACSAITEKATCQRWAYCKWNDYVIKLVKSGCQEWSSLRIADNMFEDETPQGCNELCKSRLNCVEFAFGRAEGERPARCVLYGGPCSNNGDSNYDLYKSTLKVPPSRAPNTCTHKVEYSADDSKR